MKKIKTNDLIELISDVSIGKHSDRSIREILEGLYDVILMYLEINGEIDIEDFGKFMVSERKSGTRVINDLNNPGFKKLRYVKPKLNITFKANRTFDVSVNEGDFKRLKSNSKPVSKRKQEENHNVYGDMSLHTTLINRANKRIYDKKDEGDKNEKHLSEN